MGNTHNLAGADALTTRPERDSALVCDLQDRTPEFNTEKGRESVYAVAAWLEAHGFKVKRLPTSGPNDLPYDLLVNGEKRVEVKVCFRRDDGNWKFNIHRHGILDESNVDVYVLRLEGVPDFKAALHLIIPAPLGSMTIAISLRSLITRFGRYYNRFDFIGGKDLSASKQIEPPERAEVAS